MYRFVRSPRWIAAHAVVLLLALACVMLGRWQLHRLAEKREHDRTMRARLSVPPVALDELLPLDASDTYRRVTVEGTYDAAHQVLLVGRSKDGRPGDHVLTPLRGPDLIVDRGWVPLSADRLSAEGVAPAPGRVRIGGVLLPTAHGVGSRVGGRRVPTIARVNVDALESTVPYRLQPLYLLLAEQLPAQRSPEPAPLETVGDGPHLSYALQWFSFAGVVVIGWGFFLRREARERQHGG